MKPADDVPVMTFETQDGWNAWLDEHHAELPGVWLKIAKKGSGIPSLTYAEALECALCYGWIDGQKAAFDDRYWLQRFTPRRSRSVWSRVNRDNATVLIADGKMQPAGFRQVELARRDGRWEAAYESQRTITVPEDFQYALDQNPTAQAFFNSLESANRYAILWRIQTAKKPETRAARIKKLVAMLSSGEKIHP